MKNLLKLILALLILKWLIVDNELLGKIAEKIKKTLGGLINA